MQVTLSTCIINTILYLGAKEVPLILSEISIRVYVYKKLCGELVSVKVW